MFVYEMHQHTAGPSDCGQIDPAGAVNALRASGFAGMVLTNHFIHGNTGIRRNLPWADFVYPYEEAYCEAVKAGRRCGFDVLFGMEETVLPGKEVLLYGITPALFYDHPELRDAKLEGGLGYLRYLSGLVHDAGGLVYQAHPYRVRAYIPDPWNPLPPEYLDGVETDNRHNSQLENSRALAFAEENGLLCCAGTDDHVGETETRYGIVTEERVADNETLVRILRDSHFELYVPE